MFISRILLFAVSSFYILFTLASCNEPAKANAQPIIRGISSPTYTTASSEVNLTCDAYDQDGDKLSYTWSSENGTITGQGASVTWLAPEKQGVYTVNVTVDDGRGGTNSFSREIRISFNTDGTLPVETPVILKLTLPSDEIVTDNSKRIGKWHTAPIQCIVTNTEGRILTYIWSADHGKLYAKEGLKEGTASKIDWIAPELGGDYTVNVTVSDQYGNIAKGAATIHVICCGELP